ncbi:FAD-binding protein, partial [Streptomyces sp. SID2119]|uniref:FAD-binding oxidoreductase n=2 Tax=Streptomyces TaxID=1883 RepID=UPI001370B208
IATRALDSVTVDPVRRTARIGAGASWGRVIEAAAPHGLAPLNGSSPSVGAVSYTLGGGLGILARKFGYAADHVRSLDVVTADGTARRVTPEREPELFWGLRGGGHRLGMVTGLEIALVAVERLYGGSIVFDGAWAGEVVRGYLEWTRTVPDTLTSSLAALVHPDLPQLPEELRGRYVISVRVAFTGDAAEGERLVAPLRAIGAGSVRGSHGAADSPVLS